MDVLVPTLHRELQDVLLFLQLSTAWAAISRAGPPFLAVEPSPPRPPAAALPQPGGVEGFLKRLPHWPEPGEVSELALPAPPGRESRAGTLLWWVGGFSSPDLGPGAGPSGTLYLHLVAQVAELAQKPPLLLFQRSLQRLEEALLTWTRLRQLQQQASLGQILGVVSHEVRNPLATVRASLQLGYQQASPTLRRQLTQAMGELDQTVHFMELLLKAARPSSAAAGPVDLKLLLEDLLQVYQGICAVHRVEAHLECPEAFPPVVASGVLIRQAVGNLLRNAIEAMPEGGRLTVSIRRQGIERVEIAVTDTGPGFGYDVQRRLFQPFFTSKPDGNGLGLMLVKQIAMAHGGDVTVKSRPGEGATFSLILPRSPGPGSTPLGSGG